MAEKSEMANVGHGGTEQLEPLRNQFVEQRRGAGDIPARSSKARHQPGLHGVAVDRHDHGMVPVAFFAARVDGMHVPMIAVGLVCASEAASSGKVLALLPAQRTSIAMFLPSM